MSAKQMGTMTKIGQTNLQVSNICFGTSGLGDMPETYGYSVDVDRAHDTVRAMFDGPTNFLDTSRLYGFGRSEQRVGDVIRERGGLPDGFVISTKLDRDIETTCFDGAQARRSLEQSMEALGLDRLQLVHLHDPEHVENIAEVTAADGSINELFAMKEEGLVEAVGLAAGNVDVMIPMLKEWDFDALITHNRFTLANRNAAEMMDLAHAKGVTIINAAPYCSGVLAKGTEAFPRYVYQAATDETLAPIRRIEAICAKHNVPPGAAALQFSLRDPRVGSTVCGVSKPERVQQTMNWAQHPIADEVWEELMALPFGTDDPERSRDYNPG